MVLVTGASGLLGQHIVSLLSMKGIHVRALFHSFKPVYYTDINDDFVEWKQVDILDYNALETCFENITQVYHCAAMVNYDPHFFTKMYDVNVLGTEHILNLCTYYNVHKLLFVSSIATLGVTLYGDLITEKNEFVIHTHTSKYGISKYDAEMLVWQRMAEGLNAVIINPGIILGEGDRGKSSSSLFKIVQDEFPYYTTGGTAWTDAQDVAIIMYKLMNSDIQNERFIVTAENRGFRDVFNMMAKALQVKPPSRRATPFMTSLVWRWSYLKSKLSGTIATITRETAKAAHEVHRYDNRKLLEALPDFRFRKLNETIERIARSFTNTNPEAR